MTFKIEFSYSFINSLCFLLIVILRKNFANAACVEIPVTGINNSSMYTDRAVELVNECEKNNMIYNISSNMFENMSELKKNIPVEDLDTHILYTNLDCALCNNVTQLAFADVLLSLTPKTKSFNQTKFPETISIDEQIDQMREYFDLKILYNIHHLHYRLCVKIGSSNNNGSTGKPGQHGQNGLPGPQGTLGSQGGSGQLGPAGPPGQHGDNCQPGPSGQRGDIGQAGQQRSRGSEGPRGLHGPKGPPGPPGQQGCHGSQGNKGQSGQHGPSGQSGLPGPTGPKGQSGQNGQHGAKPGPTFSSLALTFHFYFRCANVKIVADSLVRYENFRYIDKECRPIQDTFHANISITSIQDDIDLEEYVHNSTDMIVNDFNEISFKNNSELHQQIIIQVRQFVIIDRVTSHFTLEMSFHRRLLENRNLTKWQNEILFILNKSYTDYISQTIEGFFRIVIEMDDVKNEYQSFEADISAVESILTITLSSISLLFLFYRAYAQYAKKYLHNFHSRMIFNLCLALIFTNFSILFIPFAYEVKLLCNLLAAVKVFSFLASFLWMTILSIDAFLTFCPQNFHHLSGATNSRLLKYCLIGWIIPVLYSISIAVLDHIPNSISHKPYFNKGICWFLKVEDAMYFFGVPVAVSVLLSFFCFAFTILSIHFRINNKKKIESTGRPVHQFYLYAKFVCLFGITWIFGLTSFFVRNLIVSIIFIITCSSQGIFITVMTIKWNCISRKNEEDTFSNLSPPNKEISLETLA